MDFWVATGYYLAMSTQYWAVPETSPIFVLVFVVLTLGAIVTGMLTLLNRKKRPQVYFDLLAFAVIFVALISVMVVNFTVTHTERVRSLQGWLSAAYDVTVTDPQADTLLGGGKIVAQLDGETEGLALVLTERTLLGGGKVDLIVVSYDESNPVGFGDIGVRSITPSKGGSGR